MELVWISELNGMDVNGLSLWQTQSRYIPVISAKKNHCLWGIQPYRWTRDVCSVSTGKKWFVHWLIHVGEIVVRSSKYHQLDIWLWVMEACDSSLGGSLYNCNTTGPNPEWTIWWIKERTMNRHTWIFHNIVSSPIRLSSSMLFCMFSALLKQALSGSLADQNHSKSQNASCSEVPLPTFGCKRSISLTKMNFLRYFILRHLP